MSRDGLPEDYSPPSWYATIRASERLHTQPWVIDDAPRRTPPIMWGWRAQAVIVAENEASRMLHEREQRKAKNADYERRRSERMRRTEALMRGERPS